MPLVRFVFFHPLAADSTLILSYRFVISIFHFDLFLDHGKTLGKVMREIVSLQLGQCGNQLGAELYTCLGRESLGMRSSEAFFREPGLSLRRGLR